jgi:CheY-like chemotaxis protein
VRLRTLGQAPVLAERRLADVAGRRAGVAGGDGERHHVAVVTTQTDAQPSPGSHKVIVCDDAMGFPALAAAWLREAPDIELAGIATSVRELMTMIPHMRPDAVVLDHMLPEGPSSPERVAQIRELAAGVRVILVSSLPPAELAAQAEKIGADAWCSKMTTASALQAVVRGAA